MALTESLGVFVADFGVPVSFSGSVAGMKGIMDLTGSHVLGDDGRAVISAADRTVLIRTSQKGALTQGASITVNSVSYVVRDLGPIDDGSFTVVSLR
jgi:hypothetical protein